MAKITLADGMVIEGTVEELKAMTEAFGVKTEEESSETITHNGAEYTRVHRKAQPGDVVVFTENKSCCFHNNRVYGPVVMDKGDLSIPDNDGTILRVYEDCFKRTEANVKVYEPVAKEEPKLKVGDYAKVLEKVTGFLRLHVGEIVLLEDGGDGNFFAIDLEGNRIGVALKHEIVRATDEEVAEAKAKLALENAQKEHEAKEAERWAKIGRKPNEFKKGDVVRVDNPCGSPRKRGQLTEALHDSKRSSSVIVTGGWAVSVSELVAPVESRFDQRA